MLSNPVYSRLKSVSIFQSRVRNLHKDGQYNRAALMNVESQFMINMKLCPVYNFHSYFLHVIAARNMGETQGKFHDSSDYDLNALRPYYPSIILCNNYWDTCK